MKVVIRCTSENQIFYIHSTYSKVSFKVLDHFFHKMAVLYISYMERHHVYVTLSE